MKFLKSPLQYVIHELIACEIKKKEFVEFIH